MSGPTCQMYGSGVTVPCGECNMVLLDVEEYAALRARVAELEAALAAAEARAAEARANELLTLGDLTNALHDWKYMVGIAERGRGKPLPDGVKGCAYLLEYVKELERKP